MRAAPPSPPTGVLKDVDPAELRGSVSGCPGERIAVDDGRGERAGGDALGGELVEKTFEVLAVQVAPSGSLWQAQHRKMDRSIRLLDWLV